MSSAIFDAGLMESERTNDHNTKLWRFKEGYKDQERFGDVVSFQIDFTVRVSRGLTSRGVGKGVPRGEQH